MIEKKLELINEQTSPLFRIMWVHDAQEPPMRKFDNNICAFHIGNGYILSVAHNLRSTAGFPRSMNEEQYNTEILPRLDSNQKHFFDQYYPVDYLTGKRHLNDMNPQVMQEATNIFAHAGFDTRWVSLYGKKICSPHLLIQFRESAFYKDSTLTEYIHPNMQFFEGVIKRQTYMLEVELVHAFYNEDIALYNLVNVPPELVRRLPSVSVDYTLLDGDIKNFYCLQSAPVNEVGRLLNDAKLEGVLDHFTMFNDPVAGNYVVDGIRYLVKGYFRFGSSGAPYLLYNSDTQKFMVNAIQSEASPLQLSINNNMAGNFQYVNAIASPLYMVKDKLQELTSTN